jgi:hypothetical protein
MNPLERFFYIIAYAIARAWMDAQHDNAKEVNVAQKGPDSWRSGLDARLRAYAASGSSDGLSGKD